jgi:hypothetical protein
MDASASPLDVASMLPFEPDEDPEESGTMSGGL